MVTDRSGIDNDDLHLLAFVGVGSGTPRDLRRAGAGLARATLGRSSVVSTVASVGEDDAHLKAEAADLIFHLLVLLEARGVAVGDVLEVLQARMGRSGLDEKASRVPSGE